MFDDLVCIVCTTLYIVYYGKLTLTFLSPGNVNSLVNPQLNAFRRVMFSPALYGSWERLMVGTGLQNNQLFPGMRVRCVLVC